MAAGEPEHLVFYDGTCGVCHRKWEGTGARKDLDIARIAESFPGWTVGGNLKHVAFFDSTECSVGAD
jgi:hypothetical protein